MLVKLSEMIVNIDRIAAIAEHEGKYFVFWSGDEGKKDHISPDDYRLLLNIAEAMTNSLGLKRGD